MQLFGKTTHTHLPVFLPTNRADNTIEEIRLDIQNNYNHWQKLLSTKSIKSTYGTIQGEKVATSPKGFPKDDPAIDLLRYKQYWFQRSFTDKEVLAADFLNKVNQSFKNIRPFFDYVSEVLITDLNGERIV